jgi:Amt family ammonium transporter
MMQSSTLMAVVTVVWAVMGYSLAFGGNGPFVGDPPFVRLDNVGIAPNGDCAPTIPQQTFRVYRLMFAMVTSALISGVFAERMRVSAMLLFMVLWA